MNRPPDPYIKYLRYAWAYTAGRAARDAKHPTPEDHYDPQEKEYFWRAIFDDLGYLGIYGMLPGTTLYDLSVRNHGPRATMKAPRATLDAFLDFLEGIVAVDFQATPTERSNAEYGRLTFKAEQTVKLCRALYDDENVATLRANMVMAQRVIDYKRPEVQLVVA